LMAIRSAGRDRLPEWVVRIRSVLRFIPTTLRFYRFTVSRP
jgi:hypothetical protein